MGSLQNSSRNSSPHMSVDFLSECVSLSDSVVAVAGGTYESHKPLSALESYCHCHCPLLLLPSFPLSLPKYGQYPDDLVTQLCLSLSLSFPPPWSFQRTISIKEQPSLLLLLSSPLQLFD